MTGEELEQAKARILELQAQLDAKVARLSEKVDRTHERVAALLAKMRERQKRKTD